MVPTRPMGESGAANGLISTDVEDDLIQTLRMAQCSRLYILYFKDYLFWMVDVQNGQKRPINCGSIGYPFLSHSHISHTCVGDSWQTRQFVSYGNADLRSVASGGSLDTPLKTHKPLETSMEIQEIN